MPRLVLLAFCLLSLCSFPFSPAAADTVLHYISESGDYIGKGEERTITPADGFNFQVHSNANLVSIDISDATGDYGLDFAAANNAPLLVGNYPDAGNYPFQGAGHPGLDFTANGAGSDTITGGFKVLEISFDAKGLLATFAADFVQHSNGAMPACYGQIRYNSAIPYLNPAGSAELAYADYGVLSTSGSLTVSVSRIGGSTGPLSVDYATADGTDLAGRDYTAASGTLTWADGDTTDKTFTVPILNSGNPEQGNGIFYVNLGGAGAGVQSQEIVEIVYDNSVVTFVHFTSDPGDYIGGGQDRTFNIADGYLLVPSRNYAGGVSFDFNNQAAGVEDEESWTLNFGAPTGTVFGVGNYPQAERFGFQDPGYAGLELYGDGRGSNTLTGNFQVLEAVFDNSGNVLKFAAEFEQLSEGSSGALYGDVRYNSTVPVPVRLPAVSVVASTPEAHEHDSVPGVFKILRTGGGTATALTVTYKLVGSAVNGHDYEMLAGTKTIPAGKGSAKIHVRPIDLGVTSGTRTVKIKLQAPDGTYIVTDEKIARIKILRDDPVYSGPTPE